MRRVLALVLALLAVGVGAVAQEVDAALYWAVVDAFDVAWADVDAIEDVYLYEGTLFVQVAAAMEVEACEDVAALLFEAYSERDAAFDAVYFDWRKDDGMLVLRDDGATVEMVWIPTNGGKKHHKNSECSGMIDPAYVDVREALLLGFDACKRCYK